MTLYFIGDATNTWDAKTLGSINGHRLWVQLKEVGTDVKLVQHTDINQMAEEVWHEWNIPLKTFSDAGVNLSNLDCVSIGIGGTLKVGQSKASNGQIHLDDIRLYPPRCFPELAQVAGNLNDDCIIDACDLGLFGADWLVSDMNAPASPPAYLPEVWYRFDDGPGSTVVSSSGSWGSQYDIAISSPNGPNEPNWTTDVAPAVEVCDPNYAMEFDGEPYTAHGDYLAIPNSPATNFAGTQNMTIVGWVKRFGAQPSYGSGLAVSNTVAGGRSATGLAFNRAGVDLNYFWNEDYWQWEPGLTVPDDTWAIMAIAVEPTKATAYVFNSTTQALTYATNVEEHGALLQFDTDCDTWIGSDVKKGDGQLKGLLDDLRLYNKTLTIGEIMGICGLTGEVYLPNPSNANFVVKTPYLPNYDPNNPDIVNFVDYEVLANNWLTEYLWPPD
jgi:hypothetical protein